MKSLRANFIWNAAYQVVRILVPLITMPYLSRVLGSEMLGEYSYTSTAANYFVFFILLGLNQYGVREIAKMKSSRSGLSKTFCSILAMQVGSGLLVLTAYVVYLGLSPENLRLYTLIWCIWVSSEIFDVTWLFYGLEKFRAITIRDLLVKVFVVVGIFSFVHTQSDLWVYCLIQACGCFISVAILWPMVCKNVDFIKPSWKDIRVHIKPNLFLFAPVIAISFYTQVDKLFLGTMSSMSQLGFYDNAEKIVLIPLAVIQSLGTVMLPRMSEMFTSKGKEAVNEHIGVSIWFMSIMSAAFMFGIGGVSAEFVPVFFGEGFDPIIGMMPLLSLIIPVVAWSNALGMQYLIPAGKDREYLLSVIVGAVVNVGLNLLLIPLYDAYGAVIATVAAELAVTLIQILFLRGSLPFGSYLVGCLPYALIGVMMFGIIRLIGGVFGTTALGVVIEVVAGAVFFILAAVVWMAFRHDSRLKYFLPARLR